MQLIDSLAVQNTLGEGVIWDHQAAQVYWTDIEERILYRYDPLTRELVNWPTPERLCCFAPRADGLGLVAAFESGFAFYTPETNELEWIHKLELDNPGTRFNDGRTDRQGRLWSGTMVENPDTATSKGALYCLHNDLTVSVAFGGLQIPNSLCWSANGKTAYHTDTPSRLIQQYSFDTIAGQFGPAKHFVKTADGCFPDGSIIDADGYLWNAQWGGSQVVRYAPDGRQDLIVEIPTSQPSCVAFGGQELNLLIVTSAKQGLDKQARAADPLAGDLFIYETQYRGLNECGFVLSV